MTGLNPVSNNPRFGAVFVTYKNHAAGVEVENIMVKSAASYKDDEVVLYNIGTTVKLRQNQNSSAQKATNMLNPPYTNSENAVKKLKNLVCKSVKELLVEENIKKAISDFLKSRDLDSSYDNIWGEFVLYKPLGDNVFAKKLPPSIRCMGL